MFEYSCTSSVYFYVFTNIVNTVKSNKYMPLPLLLLLQVTSNKYMPLPLII